MDDFGQAKVDDLDEVTTRPRLLDHDIRGFQVSMNDAQRMRFCQGFQHLLKDGERTRQFERAFFLEKAPEVTTSKVFHHQVGKTIFGFSKVDHANEVGMAQPAGRVSFVEEAIAHTRVM